MAVYGAIEGGGTKFICGIGTREGKILDYLSIPTTTPEETLDQAIAYFSDKGVASIGIGTFGPIDVNPASPSYGSVTKTPKPHWSGFDLVGYVKKRLNIPIGFDTDVNAAALGETVWGAAKGLSSCLYLTVGTGIGGGAVVEGKLVHGLAHPEMGHISVRRHPEDTYEGSCPFHSDCLEGLAAGPAIEKRWGKKAYELEASHDAWRFQSYYIAQALVNYILILSPEKIILGGGVMNQNHLLPMIREQVQTLLNGYVHHAAILEGIDDYIVSPGLGDKAGLSGALALAIRRD